MNKVRKQRSAALPFAAAAVSSVLILTASTTAMGRAGPRLDASATPARPALLTADLSGFLDAELLSENGKVFEASIVRPALPFLAGKGTAYAEQRALDCLTAAVYHEARSEGEDGQRAVAQVVLNRVRHPAFPSSVCGVVYQGAQRRTGCQFTFTCDGSLRRRRVAADWERAKTIASDALAGGVYAPVGHSTHYHTNRVRPYWAPTLTRTASVGVHIFYRWRGAAGTPAAFSRVAAPEAQAAPELASVAVDRPRLALLPAATRAEPVAAVNPLPHPATPAASVPLLVAMEGATPAS